MSKCTDFPRWHAAAWPAAALLVAACGGTPAPAPSPAPAPAAAPSAPVAAEPAPMPTPTPTPPPPAAAPVFGAFASQKVVVFPLQRYAVSDSAWMPASGAVGRARAAVFDSTLTAALRDRGLGASWSLPPNTSRVAQGDVMNRTDPRALPTVGLAPSRRPNDLDLREPLATQLRAIVALVPDGRMVLVPLEARVTGGAGARQATLRLAFLDARQSSVVSFPDVTGPAASDERAALRAAVEKFADMVVVP
ncbi:MAG: hypothetical protein IT355_00405 [Gemmatimonadaceae bacterium]|nr:hypothetical protein [Gemmatimonadaceae bacterium]